MSEEALQIDEKKREAKSKEEKERYTHLNAEFQRIARREIRKPSLMKRIEENNRRGKSRELIQILELPREHFMQRWA